MICFCRVVDDGIYNVVDIKMISLSLTETIDSGSIIISQRESNVVRVIVTFG